MKIQTFIFTILFLSIVQIKFVKADEEEEEGVISFDMGDEKENLRNFKKISEDLQEYEDDYIKCITNIKDDDYTQEAIDECIGKDYVKIILDIKYESMKIMSKAETKLRDFFIKNCYSEAGVDPSFSMACDILEHDVLDFMWNGLNFKKLVEINRRKYSEEYGEIPKKTMKKIIKFLDVFGEEFFKLLNEVDDHKEMAILHLKDAIEERIKVIAKDNGDTDSKPHIIKHTIHIEEELKSPEDKKREEENKQLEKEENNDQEDEKTKDSSNESKEESDENNEKEEDSAEDNEETDTKNDLEQENNDEEVIEVPERKLPANQIQIGSPDEFTLPKRKLVKANTSTIKKLKDSGVRIFNHHGKYSGLNSPNYAYKERSSRSRHFSHGVNRRLSHNINPETLKSKNIHTSYLKNRGGFRRYSK